MSAADDFYLQQQTVTRTTANAVQGWFSQLDPHNLSASWNAGVGAQVVRATTAGQLLAAANAQPYVEASVQEQGEQPDPAGIVNATALAGVASDGRPLEGLLYLPIIKVKQRLAAGQSLTQALTGGIADLIGLAGTQVQDAGRAATAVAMTADRNVYGWEREVHPPSCSRCLVLAGRVYSHSSGFQRHKHCDCTHKIVVRYVKPARPLETPSGMVVAGDATPAGTAMPEELLRRAGDDRDAGIAALRAGGFLR